MCVTITIVIPFLFKSKSIFTISSDVLLSNEPVGSSDVYKSQSIDKAKFTDYKYLYPDQFSEISSILEKGYVAFNFDRRMRKLVRCV